jgi:hypothetical protein
LFTSEEIKSDAFKKRLTRFGFGAKTVPLKTVPMSAAHSGFNTAITRALFDTDTSTNSSVDRFGNGVADALLYAFFIGSRLGAATPVTVSPDDFETWKTKRSIADTAYKALQHIPGEYNKYIEGLVPAFTYFQEDMKRREVGKVLSYAAPGKGVDVLFGSS